MRPRMMLEFDKEEAERELAKKLPELKRNPQLKALQRGISTLEIEAGEALIHAIESQVPKDDIADLFIKMAIAVKLGGTDVKVIEAGNEFARRLLRELPPTLN